ncbi:MAG: hypothetical protein HY036_05365 [Nitrospirae bacterium]|nr:hypothetical protein [Nitrospirota bacterium]MBI3351990.1 hypothetical protein [Nitrospirota bacterium]
MKHFLYAFYVTFYASAVFLAGLFAGQMVERKNAQKNPDRSRLKNTSDAIETGTGTMAKSDSKAY